MGVAIGVGVFGDGSTPAKVALPALSRVGAGVPIRGGDSGRCSAGVSPAQA